VSGAADPRAQVGERVQAAERVRVVFAAAITHAVRQLYGTRLPWNEALRLAEAGSIAAVLDRLREQRRIRRTLPGGASLTPESRERLAVVEVVADVSGAFDGDAAGRRQMIADALTREAELARAAEQVEDERRAVEALTRELEARGPAERELIRRASRLLAEQRGRLAEAIRDPEQRERALARLDEVYARYLGFALKSGDLASPATS
jgi:hypothetical protein